MKPIVSFPVWPGWSFKVYFGSWPGKPKCEPYSTVYDGVTFHVLHVGSLSLQISNE